MANCCPCSIVSVRAAEMARIAAYPGMEDEAVVRPFTVRNGDSSRVRTLAGGKTGCVWKTAYAQKGPSAREDVEAARPIRQAGSTGERRGAIRLEQAARARN